MKHKLTKKNRKTQKKINHRNKKGGTVRGFFGRKRENNILTKSEIDKVPLPIDLPKNEPVRIFSDDGTFDGSQIYIKCHGNRQPEFKIDVSKTSEWIKNDVSIDLTNPEKYRHTYINYNSYLNYEKDSYKCAGDGYNRNPITNVLRTEKGAIIAMRPYRGNESTKNPISGPMYPYYKYSKNKSARFTLTLNSDDYMYLNKPFQNTSTNNNNGGIIILPRKIDDDSNGIEEVIDMEGTKKKYKPIYILSGIKNESTDKYDPVMKIEKSNIKISNKKHIYNVSYIKKIKVKGESTSNSTQFDYEYEFMDDNYYNLENINKDHPQIDTLSQYINSILDGEAQKTNDAVLDFLKA
jgi:hypothetical protein